MWNSRGISANPHGLEKKVPSLVASLILLLYTNILLYKASTTAYSGKIGPWKFGHIDDEGLFRFPRLFFFFYLCAANFHSIAFHVF
jgi:hypothetical protein